MLPHLPDHYIDYGLPQHVNFQTRDYGLPQHVNFQTSDYGLPQHVNFQTRDYGLPQHVNFPTHKLGHTLDVIITFSNSPRVTNFTSNEYGISHHFLVHFDIDIVPEKRLRKVMYYRNTKSIDFNQVNDNIRWKTTHFRHSPSKIT